MSDPFAHASDHLRTHDFAWYASLQFAPAERRPALMALFAYLAEIARIRSLVSDPMPGEIRLQWWRDALSGTPHGAVEANPLAAALLAARDRHRWPPAPLLAVLDGRTFELYDDAFPDTDAFEAHAGEVWSGPMALALGLLTGQSPAAFADVAGHGGVALTVARALDTLPRWAARGQCLVPMPLLDGAGADRAALKEGRATDELAAALRAFASYGVGHLDRAAQAASAVPAAGWPVLLPLALARATLTRAQGWASAPFAASLAPPRWRLLVALWRASRRMPVV